MVVMGKTVVKVRIAASAKMVAGVKVTAVVKVAINMKNSSYHFSITNF